MFGLFNKKDPSVKVRDKVIIDATAKLKTLFTAWNTNKNTVLIFWFDESLDEATNFFSTLTTEPVTLLTAREASHTQLAGKTILFAEHYPLRSKEEELFVRLGLKEVTVFSSLQEPLFKMFGADKIIQVMKQLGIKEDEMIEHAMISKSIRNAQKKIEDKLVTEFSAHSQSGWLEKNFPAANT
ncbi:MAG: hypothetical protein ABIR30_02865 [Chitinophagaceae bacterium]